MGLAARRADAFLLGESMNASFRRLSVRLAIAAAALAFAAWLPLTAPPAAAQGTVKMEWLGWSFFRFTSVNGKVILTNPFIQGNPDAAVSLDDITQADLILPADGHPDEQGATIAIAQKTGARVLAQGELATWMIEQGLPAATFPRRFAAPGTFYSLDGVMVRVVNSIHGSGLPQPTATAPYGGLADGFYITFENGWTVYFTGSSAATADQALWGDMYKPDAMIFHMGTGTEPLDVAAAIRFTTTDNPNLRTLMPHHHRVSPPAGATTVGEVQAALAGMGIGLPITDQVRSQVYEFTK